MAAPGTSAITDLIPEAEQESIDVEITRKNHGAKLPNESADHPASALHAPDAIPTYRSYKYVYPCG